MNSKQISPTSPVTDKLIELVNAALYQGTLADLSEDELSAIARPDSILGFVTLLNTVDQSSQEAIIALVDIDYLVKHFIFNPQQLGACLAVSPLLAQRLLEHSVIDDQINGSDPLIQVIQIAPQYATTLLARPKLLGLLTEFRSLALIINAAPECANDLLTDPKILAACFSAGVCNDFFREVKGVPECAIILADYLSSKIVGGGVLSDTLFAAPQLCDKMLKNPTMCALIDDEFVLTIIIQRTPQSADILLARREMLALIKTVQGLGSIIKSAPQWGTRLLNDPTLCALIKTGEDVVCLIKEAPQLAVLLLSNPEMRALIQDGLLIKKIVLAAPHCVNPSLSVAQVTAFYSLPSHGALDPKLLIDLSWQWATFTNLLSESDYAAAATKYIALITDQARTLWEESQNVANDSALYWMIDYLRAAPQCAEFLLADSSKLALMGDYLLIKIIVSTDARYHNRLLAEASRRRWNFPYYDRHIHNAITVLPQLAEILFERSDIRNYIDQFELIEALLTASPKCAEVLFRDDRVFKYNIYFLMDMIRLAPESADILLNHPLWSESINSAQSLRDVIEFSPDCADSLLEDQRLQKFISGHALELLLLAPQCAKTIYLHTDPVQGTKGDYLAKFTEAASEDELEVVVSELTKPNAGHIFTNGEQIASFLTRLPKLLPVTYPFCYLLKKPEDIARVLCQIAIDDVWDHTAKLPAIHTNILWPLGGKMLNNVLLNQLTHALEQTNTPRSLLMQAYLLMQAARELDAELTVENGDDAATAIFTTLKKCHHDALKLLAALYQSEPKLLSSVKNLLIQIEAMHITHVALLNESTQFKNKKALRVSIKHQNARMQLHLAHVHFSCGTNTFSNFLESRFKFGEAHALQIPLLRFGSFWQQFDCKDVEDLPIKFVTIHHSTFIP